ncbi:MAG: RNA-binding protein [Clostridia bacterium]|jgi:large subunit ribosomal protein L14e
MENSLEIGRVVMSKAGRDRGRYFVVVEKLDENYVMIADGDLRKIDKAKKKKYKHLKAKKELISSIQAKILSGEPVLDSEIRRSLEALGYNKRIPEGKEE